MRIIACGNRDRGDDAAGILVGERLRSLGIPVEIQTGEALALLEAWSDANEVIVVDTVVTGAHPGMLHRWDGTELRLDIRSQPSSHGFGIAEAIQLSRTLNCLPHRLRIYGIEGHEFGCGLSPSPEIALAVEKVVEDIRDLVRSKETAELSRMSQNARVA